MECVHVHNVQPGVLLAAAAQRRFVPFSTLSIKLAGAASKMSDLEGLDEAALQAMVRAQNHVIDRA